MKQRYTIIAIGYLELQLPDTKSGTIASMNILRSPADLTPTDIRRIYNNFDVPITALDCGQECAPQNHGIPFCCDTCHAVPAAYTSEWDFLKDATNLWHAYRGDECASVPDPEAERARLEADTPESMTLLACLGHTRCQRNFRAIACRQFPFFPYVTADYRFIGLAYEWTFEGKCRVIEHLDQVTPQYRQQFIATFDFIFANFDEEFDAYAEKSSQARGYFSAEKRRIPILHRNGSNYLLSPASERLQKITP